ncbi:MAG: hypothetical protein IJG34_10240 [Synergistaceae bacterium]|nr:hypothetical protein [Synergistaceae bacterium]MBQ3694361.1 hypothetical protein [Synergistaceae bacterium]MBQ6111700.1 hypothetical protein [Synergistaceae bacterium]MBQ9627627.1 hypothetical protein [Synergistaceae bacterium]MBR0069865.1 hypothetical protein [Synergistaceae bacterium]
MKRSKAFILVEILTGMVLQTGFILVLCTSFYLMLSFYSRTQQVLNARQKGGKVIAYVDSRIRNVGLGLGKCSSSSEVRDSLCKVINLSGMKPQLKFPAAITRGDGSNVGENKTSAGINEDNKIKGNILTLLYTQKPLDFNFTIRTTESTDAIVSGCNYPMLLSSDTSNNACVNAGFISGANHKYGDNNSEFNKNDDHSSRRAYLNSYTVMAGTGRPLYIGPVSNNGEFKLYLFTETQPASPKYIEKVYPGDELLYLKCERMFVKDNNFMFWKFSGKGWNDDSNKAYPNEADILEVYFELDTVNNILDMYVLASGGVNDAGNTTRPEIWPASATWNTNFANYIVYVSRASWKLKNLRSNFNWN